MALLTGQSGIPAGFQQDYDYINSKVNALNKSGAEGRNNWTYGDVSKAITNEGWTPQQHYQIAGKNEGLSWPATSPAQTQNVNPLQAYGQDLTGKQGQVSYSGLPEADQRTLIDSLLPKLLASTQNYRGDIDRSKNAIQEKYAMSAKDAMKSGSQNVLNSMAGRNMLNSSVTSDALAKVGTNIADLIAGKNYDAESLAAGLKAQEPTMLGGLLNLGNSSKSSNDLSVIDMMRQIYQGMM